MIQHWGPPTRCQVRTLKLDTQYIMYSPTRFLEKMQNKRESNVNDTSLIYYGGALLLWYANCSRKNRDQSRRRKHNIRIITLTKLLSHVSVFRYDISYSQKRGPMYKFSLWIRILSGAYHLPISLNTLGGSFLVRFFVL